MTELSIQALCSFLSAWWFSQSGDNQILLLAGTGLSAFVTLCLWVMRQSRKEQKEKGGIRANGRIYPKDIWQKTEAYAAALKPNRKARKAKPRIRKYTPWWHNPGLDCLACGLALLGLSACRYFTGEAPWPVPIDRWLFLPGAFLVPIGVLIWVFTAGANDRPPNIRKPGDRDNVGQFHPDGLGKRCGACCRHPGMNWQSKDTEYSHCPTVGGFVRRNGACGDWVGGGKELPIDLIGKLNPLPAPLHHSMPCSILPQAECEAMFAARKDGKVWSWRESGTTATRTCKNCDHGEHLDDAGGGYWCHRAKDHIHRDVCNRPCASFRVGARNALAHNRGILDSGSIEYKICECLSLVEESERVSLESSIRHLLKSDWRPDFKIIQGVYEALSSGREIDWSAISAYVGSASIATEKGEFL